MDMRVSGSGIELNLLNKNCLQRLISPSPYLGGGKSAHPYELFIENGKIRRPEACDILTFNF